MTDRAPLNRYSDRGLLETILETVDAQTALITTTFAEWSTKMADLTQSVDALQAAVQEVRDRVTGSLTPLQEALAAAQQALVDFQAADATEDAAYEAKQAELQSALDALGTKVDEAVSEIDQATEDLNNIAQPEPDPEPDPDNPPSARGRKR
jgi:chromosome segregation ATPase